MNQQRQRKLAPLLSSKKDDWRSPERILAPVREFTSPAGVGVDPCGGSLSIVDAKIEYRLDRGEDGLVLPWGGHGTVYENPPYSRIALWAEKTVSEAALGTEILILTPSRTDTRWFALLRAAANAACYVQGRLKFLGARSSAPFPSAIFYFGQRVKRFCKVFSKLGHVDGLRDPQRGREPGPRLYDVFDEEWAEQEEQRRAWAEERRDNMLLDQALTDPPAHAVAPTSPLEVVLDADDELPIDDQFADRLEIEAASHAWLDDERE